MRIGFPGRPICIQLIPVAVVAEVHVLVLVVRVVHDAGPVVLPLRVGLAVKMKMDTVLIGYFDIKVVGEAAKLSYYRASHVLEDWVLLTWIWNVPPSCLGSR